MVAMLTDEEYRQHRRHAQYKYTEIQNNSWSNNLRGKVTAMFQTERKCVDSVD